MPQATRQRFTAPRRKQLLELIQAGQSVAAARAAVGVSDATVRNWLARADSKPGDQEAQDFAAAYREAVAQPRGRKPRPGQLAKAHRDGHLTADELVAMLEERARAGSESAMRFLLARLDAQAKDTQAEPQQRTRGQEILDQLAALREAKSRQHAVQ